MNVQHSSPQPVATIICMSATRSDLKSTHGLTREVVAIDLSPLPRQTKENLAATLCELHGIGTPAQLRAHRHDLWKEQKARNRAQRKQRLAKAQQRKHLEAAI